MKTLTQAQATDEAIFLARQILRRLEDLEQEEQKITNKGLKIISKVLDKENTTRKQQILDDLEVLFPIYFQYWMISESTLIISQSD